MAIPVTREVKVLEAKYVEEAQSILILGECKEGRFHQQIHRNCFSYGNRTEAEIAKELEKTAEMMIGKTINIAFDPDLNGKIRDKAGLKYKKPK